jgi:hypothetical protein
MIGSALLAVIALAIVAVVVLCRFFRPYGMGRKIDMAILLADGGSANRYRGPPMTLAGFRIAPFPLHRWQMIAPLPMHLAQVMPW